ncbi:hypothetical protein Trydic_g15250 [Trypoxylus dichotomus]
MNSYSSNDYIASSNNSVNENSLNAKKARSTLHQIKRLLKSLVKKTKKSSYKEQVPDAYYIDEYEAEIEDNLANELLEARILREIEDLDDFAGVPVYNQGRMDVVPVYKDQRFVPVHFARTEAGTFFWTSLSNADGDISSCGDLNAITRKQLPELQVPCDRWAQA